jgi:hypothetical protein
MNDRNPWSFTMLLDTEETEAVASNLTQELDRQLGTIFAALISTDHDNVSPKVLARQRLRVLLKVSAHLGALTAAALEGSGL